MKKTYEKPIFVARQALSKVTAQSAPSEAPPTPLP